MGISQAAFYIWRKKYGGLGPSELRCLKQSEEENSKLKRLVADLSLDKAMLQDVLSKRSLSDILGKPSQHQKSVLQKTGGP
ncbi:transposase of ISMex11, IS3 family [Mycoavidus cysteinexigens]|uniref:Transposase of ISMex11, IS3 family n=1 Tax=Mycoavidus cysteinexigens TaxID=1553431 RepID=A0A2Z6ETW2_9BURK|nr:transposase of ISMex11, IS3 family [Mycoavidus cysteinexigens]GAM52411.1 hypothetical protein EBME_0874 [bacterium endosymbiont of Mortierella elongata FMR23-6]GLR02196.1 hypothetical protein GCM10007934_20110 [Mycoavidus cysteinexigens]